MQFIDSRQAVMQWSLRDCAKIISCNWVFADCTIHRWKPVKNQALVISQHLIDKQCGWPLALLIIELCLQVCYPISRTNFIWMTAKEACCRPHSWFPTWFGRPSSVIWATGIRDGGTWSQEWRYGVPPHSSDRLCAHTVHSRCSGQWSASVKLPTAQSPQPSFPIYLLMIFAQKC